MHDRPRRVLAAPHPWPLHDVAGTRRLEAAALCATPPHALMARAGLAAARLALAVAPHARRVGVLVGPGNNGGDALIAALHLQRKGVAVTALALADPDRLPADAANAWQQARAAALPRVDDFAELGPVDLLIDGLLGLGATRAPQGRLAETIAAVNCGEHPVLAIDLPSGLAADQGHVPGQEAIRARWTLALLTLKPGLFTAAGRDHAGEVWFDDLGVEATAPTAWLGACSNPPAPGLPVRRHAHHKGSFGNLYVVGGAVGMQGALHLAAHAALTAGAGRVWASPLDPGWRPPVPELMLCHAAWQMDAATLRGATIVCGCGGGDAVAQTLPNLLAHVPRLLLDADALNAIAHDTALGRALHERAARGQHTVLTPHPLEAARLLGTSSATVQSDRLAAAQRLAEAWQAIVLLKGSGSIVAAPGRTPWINASGNAALATPGSGDVLAGWMGGLWARQAGADDGWHTARAAVWLHGHAADRMQQRHPAYARLPLRAGDLADAMAAALDGPFDSAP